MRSNHVDLTEDTRETLDQCIALANAERDATHRFFSPWTDGECVHVALKLWLEELKRRAPHPAPTEAHNAS